MRINERYRIQIFFLILLILSHSSTFSQEVINWKDAHKYYGKYITIEGTIVDCTRSYD